MSVDVTDASPLLKAVSYNFHVKYPVYFIIENHCSAFSSHPRTKARLVINSKSMNNAYESPEPILSATKSVLQILQGNCGE